jgi:hypothetical protein
VRAPGLLWIFGEPGEPLVEVSVEGATPAELRPMDRAHLKDADRLFPESTIAMTHVDSAGDESRSWFEMVRPPRD